MATATMMFQFNELNFFFIYFFSLFFIFSAVNLRINDTLYRYISILTPCVLEIYLLHAYFSLRPTGNHIVDFSVSFITVLILSIILNRFSKVLAR